MSVGAQVMNRQEEGKEESTVKNVQCERQESDVVTMTSRKDKSDVVLMSCHSCCGPSTHTCCTLAAAQICKPCSPQ